MEQKIRKIINKNSLIRRKVILEDSTEIQKRKELKRDFESILNLRVILALTQLKNFFLSKIKI